VAGGGDAARRPDAAIDTSRIKDIGDLNAVIGRVSDDEHSAATHSSRTEPVQRPYREPAA